jgi:threonine dehydratase
MSSVDCGSDIFDQIIAAKDRVYEIASRTPLVASQVIPDSLLNLKLEHVQPTGSFKIRGATNAILALTSEERERGVVCCSTGNHGRALAYAAKKLGIRITVCLSTLVPQTKVELVRASGATVVQQGNSQDDALEKAIQIAESSGAKLIPPFDDPLVLGGQGTIGLEICEQMPDIDALLIPLSGGGLAGGVATAVKTLKPHVRIIGISMDRGAAMYESMQAGRAVAVPEYTSLADSLGGGIGLANRYTLSLCKSLLDEVILVTEQEIYDGMRALYWNDVIAAEGGCAVGIAAILAGKVELVGPTATIISGRNVDPKQFASVIVGETLTLDDITVRGPLK